MSDKRETELLCRKHGFYGKAADQYGRPKQWCPECQNEEMNRERVLRDRGYELAPWQSGLPAHEQLWVGPGAHRPIMTLQEIIKHEHITQER